MFKVPEEKEMHRMVVGTVAGEDLPFLKGPASTLLWSVVDMREEPSC